MPSEADLADLPTERALLGAAIQDEHAYAEAAGLVTAADFYRGAHRTVWETVAEMRTRRAPVDVVTVVDELERRGTLDAAGGATAIADVVAACPSPASASRYAETVVELSRRRHAAGVYRDAYNAVLDRSVDYDKAVSDAADRITESRPQGGTVPLEELLDGVLREHERGREQYGYGPPWHNLRDVWRIVPGWVHVVLGWNSAGKSALVDALVVELARRDGLRTAMWSPEGAPNYSHLLRLARIAAGSTLEGASAGDVVLWVEWVYRYLTFVRHDHTRLPAILTAADAERLSGGLDVLVVDPFTSLEKDDAEEAWDRVINRHLSRLQAWARSRGVAVVVVAHPKQRDKVPWTRPDGARVHTRPIATPTDIAGGAMWGNMADSFVSVWRDEGGQLQPRAQVDVHVQKVRDEGPGGWMGERATLVRDDTGRYRPLHPPEQPNII